MIIVNGSIEVKHKQGGGIDPTTGYAIPAASEWGEPIPCQYYYTLYNQLARVNGEHYTARAYTILIEQRTFTAEQIRLRDRLGNIVGEFSIQQIEPLDAVGQYRILV